MHEDWVRQVDLELDGELSLPERAALSRHLEMRVAFARSAGEPHARTVPRPRIRARALAIAVALALVAGAAAGWLAYGRWGGPGAGPLEATRATFVAQ